MSEIDAKAADKVEKVAAILSTERVSGWSNPLVVDLMDVVRHLRATPPEPDTGDAVLSAARPAPVEGPVVETVAEVMAEQRGWRWAECSPRIRREWVAQAQAAVSVIRSVVEEERLKSEGAFPHWQMHHATLDVLLSRLETGPVPQDETWSSWPELDEMNDRDFWGALKTKAEERLAAGATEITIKLSLFELMLKSLQESAAFSETGPVPGSGEVERTALWLANAADCVGVVHFDTDTMDAEVQEMRDATLAVREALDRLETGPVPESGWRPIETAEEGIPALCRWAGEPFDPAVMHRENGRWVHLTADMDTVLPHKQPTHFLYFSDLPSPPQTEGEG